MLLDASFFTVLLFAFIIGWKKGLIASLFSIAGYFIAAIAALSLSAIVAQKLGMHVNVNARFLPVLTYLAVFFITLWVVNRVGNLFQHFSTALMLNSVNRFAGGMLHILFATLFYSILVFFVEQLRFINENTINESTTYPIVKPVAPYVISILGYILPFIKNIFSALKDFFEGFSNKLTV